MLRKIDAEEDRQASCQRVVSTLLFIAVSASTRALLEVRRRRGQRTMSKYVWRERRGNAVRGRIRDATGKNVTVCALLQLLMMVLIVNPRQAATTAFLLPADGVIRRGSRRPHRSSSATTHQARIRRRIPFTFAASSVATSTSSFSGDDNDVRKQKQQQQDQVVRSNSFPAPAPVTSRELPRSNVLYLLSSAALLLPLPLFSLSSSVDAFEGGVGGLGKTKPETGVVLLDTGVRGMRKTKPETGAVLLDGASSPVTQDAKTGTISAELLIGNRQPARVTFDAPWPLLPSTSGVEARDLKTSESAFVQVVSLAGNSKQIVPKTKSEARQLLLDSVLSQKGKFGAYGSPTDIKVKILSDGDSSSSNEALYSVTFTTLTPGQRESERQVLVKAAAVADSGIVMLVTGTTRLNFASKQPVFEQICDSFEVFATPATKLRSQ